MATSLLLLSMLVAAPACAQIIYATSYNDHAVTALKLSGSSLTVLSKSYDCGSEPTWLTLDHANSVLYCLNEGWGGNASITSYSTSADGSLTELDILPVLKSPVASTLFADGKGLAVAFYDTSSFATFSVAAAKDLAKVQTETYTLAVPGTNPERQDAPHLHDSVLDPTGKYLLVPDLGSDLIRIYQTTAGSLSVKELTPIKATPGSGPRHAAFAVVKDSTYFYTVNELSNTISAYTVSYACGSAPVFTRISEFSTHGPGGSVPKGTKSAEIEVSPDQRFVIVSSRLESTLTFPNYDPTNSTAIASDPLISFAIDGKTGLLTLAQVAAAGGVNPRGFSLNKAGTLLVSALQDDNRVVVFERDVQTGLLGKAIASAIVGVGAGNGPNYALFSE